MMQCPVCKTKTTEENQEYCHTCAWEFEYFLGELSDVEKYNKRLNITRNMYEKSMVKPQQVFVKKDHAKVDLIKDSNNVTVIDDLMWQDEVTSQELDWEDSLQYSKSLRLNGYNDWRLPTCGELKSLYTQGKRLKYSVEDLYWSCDIEDDSSRAYRIYFRNGSISHSGRYNKFYVRCVRNVQEKNQIVVIDGLMYQNQPFLDKYTRGEAMAYAKSLRLGGYDDWRLPTMKELHKISNIKIQGRDSDFEKWYDENKHKRLKNAKGGKHFMRQEFIENMPSSSFFWTIEAKDSSYMWFVCFLFGNNFYLPKNESQYVLCVR